MRVILDSSVLTAGDWGLSGAAAQALLAGSQRGRLRLRIPELVVREVTNSQAERERTAISKVNAEQKKLRRLQDHFEIDSPAIPDPEPVKDAFAAQFRRRLEEARARITPLIDTPHEEIVDRALARRRPFDTEGHKGYRDTLIWLSVLDDLSGSEVTVFATKDSDFLAKDDKSKLHQHLRDDLIERGFDPDSLLVCNSLESAVEIALEPAREVVEKLNELMGGDEGFRERIEEELNGLAYDTWAIDDDEVEITIDKGFEPFADGVEEQELGEVYGLGSVVFTEAYAISEERFVISAESRGEASYKLSLSTSGFWRDPSRVPGDLDLSADERHAYIGGSASILLLLRAEYDAKTGELGELELEQMVNEPA